MGKQNRLRVGKRKQRAVDGLISAYAMPSGRFWKRLAAKKVRKQGEMINGQMYKKLWGAISLVLVSI